MIKKLKEKWFWLKKRFRKDKIETKAGNITKTERFTDDTHTVVVNLEDKVREEQKKELIKLIEEGEKTSESLKLAQTKFEEIETKADGLSKKLENKLERIDKEIKATKSIVVAGFWLITIMTVGVFIGYWINITNKNDFIEKINNFYTKIEIDKKLTVVENESEVDEIKKCVVTFGLDYKCFKD